MKKLITVITLSISLLVPTLILNNNQKIILYVNSSNFDSLYGYYINSALDENGEQYIIESHDNISGKWLDATITNKDEITGYTFLK